MKDGDGLPEGWAEARIGDIGKLVRGVSYDKSAARNDSQDGYVPVLRATNIQNERLVTDADLVYVPNRFVNSEQLLQPQDVVICMSSGSKSLVGKAAQLSNSWRGTFGAFCAVVRFYPALDTSYLGHFFSGPRYRSFIRQQSSGININNLRHGDVEQLVVPLAPLAEQRRIVEVIEQQFTRLDAGVAALKRARAALKRYRAAVLKAAVEGKLTSAWRAEHPNVEPASDLLQRILAERRARWEADMRAKGKDPAKTRYAAPEAPDTTNLPELPEGWCWASLEQLSTLVTSGSRGWADFYSDHGPLFIRAQDIKTDSLNLCNVAHVNLPLSVEGQRTRVSRNDLLVTITGANVTKTALVQDDLGEAYVSQHVGLVRPVLCAIAAYLYYWIITPTHGRRVLEYRAYGAGKPGLSLDNLRELVIAIPSLAEQEQIVAEVEERLSIVSELEATIEANLKRADRLLQSILERAFAGKLVPQCPDDEPASVLLERIREQRECSRLAQRNSRQPVRNGHNGRNDHQDIATLSPVQERLWRGE